MGHDLFWRGMFDFQHAKPPHYDNTDGWFYERGRLFAAFLSHARGKQLARPKTPMQVRRVKMWLGWAFAQGAVI
jgi:hypothetical protein